MVPVASRRVSRAPRYSGIDFESGSFLSTWLSHSVAPLSRGLRLTTRLVTLLLSTLQPLLHPISVLRYRLRVWFVFVYVAITLCGPSFQRASTNDQIGNSTIVDPTTPASPDIGTQVSTSSLVRFCLRGYHTLWPLFPEGFD